jgi:chromosome segregation ATPase
MLTDEQKRDRSTIRSLAAKKGHFERKRLELQQKERELTELQASAQRTETDLISAQTRIREMTTERALLVQALDMATKEVDLCKETISGYAEGDAANKATLECMRQKEVLYLGQIQSLTDSQTEREEAIKKLQAFVTVTNSSSDSSTSSSTPSVVMLIQKQTFEALIFCLWIEYREISREISLSNFFVDFLIFRKSVFLNWLRRISNDCCKSL